VLKPVQVANNKIAGVERLKFYSLISECYGVGGVTCLNSNEGTFCKEYDWLLN
jgi:hypothetical protein